MIVIDDVSKCCGCEACVQRCPRGCIEMKADHEGFFYPSVDTLQCIGCGACNRVCPIQNGQSEISNIVPKAYAAFAQDSEIRKESSSGGIFTVLSGQIIKQNGRVFGAVMSEDCKTVFHAKAQDLPELVAMRGSKYVQSRILDTYVSVEKELKNNKIVLFSGTPCQVEGLKGYLGKEYENLVCVDLICHGVPSPKLWKKYVEYREKCTGARVKKIWFRFKKYGWKRYSVLFQFSNNAEYESIFLKDVYGQMFCQNICLRPACYQCNFKSLHHKSDITLADFWGCENICPELDDDKGLSLVLVHSDRGSKLLDLISPYVVTKQVDERWINENKKIIQPTVKPANRDKFYEKIDQKSIKWLAVKYLPIKGKLLMIIPISVQEQIKRLLK
jgi:coenzyme F420-reducing hydrogenase beta subunit